MNFFRALAYTGPKSDVPKEFSTILRSLELVALSGAIAIALLRWFYKFRIWPDSANYLSAALNLVHHGKLFVNVNWPDQGFQPLFIPFTAYPPGYPLFLSFFILIFKDPLVASVIAQGCALVCFYILLYRVTVVLDFIPTIRIATILFFLIFAAFNQIQTGLLNEILYIDLCLGVYLCALSLWEKDNKKVWTLALLLIFLGGSVRWNGFSNGAMLLLPILKHRKYWKTKFILLGLSATLPNLLWFLRNKLVVGSSTNLYNIVGILWENIPTPFNFTIDRWGFGHLWVLLLILFTALAPLLFFRLRKNLSFAFYSFTLIDCIIQFLIIYILTLLVMVTPIDDRYLSPSYTFFVFLLFYSVNTMIRSVKMLRLLMVVPWVFLIISLPAVIYSLKMRPITWVGTFSRPPEEEFWRQITPKPYYQAASHFYSDDNFTHQIFVDKPHRIIWTNIPESRPSIISDLWKIGTKPFFVMAPNSPLLNYFEHKGGLSAGMKKEFVAGFWVIYKD